MSAETQSSSAQPAHTSPRWQPLEAIERRILGVLVEKAKTTPENYPLSLNALKSGCNQKNNRSPLTQLEEPAIEEALEKLRKVGAVAQVQGTSRVDRFRHLAYDWLGVEKVELAVMAELLLRGAQTIGELRGRAARMEPIKDLSELRPTLDSLEKKRLIQYLTPPGRGCVVTHTLYLDREMDKVRREADAMHAASAASAGSEPAEESPSPAAAPQRSSQPAAVQQGDRNNWGEQISALREELSTLKRELAAARSEFESTAAQLQSDLAELNRQLGN
jgi:uncharacterized protein YceH (UPF0502 family)